MKSVKYYSLDECQNDEKVMNKLNSLMDDRKIDYEFVETDIIKIKDLSLTSKETKELNQFLHDNDVLEDHDFDEYSDEEDDDDDLYSTDDDDY